MPEMITQEWSAAFVGRRQQYMNFSASTVICPVNVCRMSVIGYEGGSLDRVAQG